MAVVVRYGSSFSLIDPTARAGEPVVRRPCMRAPAALTVCVLLGWSAVAAAASDGRLIDAVKRHDTAAARSLIKAGVDVNATQADGATALHWAAQWDDVEVADLLIRA